MSIIDNSIFDGHVACEENKIDLNNIYASIQLDKMIYAFKSLST